MAIEFNIPQLIAMSTDIRYNPGLSAAVNRLLSVRTEDDYQIALKEATQLAIGYSVQTPEQRKDYGINTNAVFSGVPLFQPLTIKGENVGERDILLDGAVVSFNMSRNIVKTVVQGRDSSIKEFINNGDYTINVSGILYDRINYPLDKVVELDSMLKQKVALEIVHEVLNAIGVYQIVVDSFDMPKTPQFNVQTYSITATSDTPIPLQIGDLPDFLN